MTGVDARIYRIVDALIRQTEAHNIQWATTDDEEKFLYNGDKSSILVDTNAHRDPKPYWLNILNERGVLIETVEVAENEDPWGDGDGFSEKLIRLYNLARRSALQIDVALDSVLQELEDMPPF